MAIDIRLVRAHDTENKLHAKHRKVFEDPVHVARGTVHGRIKWLHDQVETTAKSIGEGLPQASHAVCKPFMKEALTKRFTFVGNSSET